ncbi:MAG: GAF domain-containing protein [Bacteroidales bacterium]|nr:GAF domain-containing protein [Bacteroidales bacterium]
MQNSRIKYLLTWLSLAVLLSSGTLLMVTAWNSQVLGPVSPGWLIMLLVFLSASGIYLFMLAVKKAHRQWINEKREQESLKQGENQKTRVRPGSSRETKALDFASAARKIVRRLPEKIAREQLGSFLLKNLARELEIMSGVFYQEEKGEFTALATYAMTASTEPYSFKSGEGLSGQVAKNQQLMVMTRLPEGHLEVYSGLGKAAPSYLAIVPLVHKGRTMAVLECSGYRYDPGDIENMFKILSRELVEKLSPNLS